MAYDVRLRAGVKIVSWFLFLAAVAGYFLWPYHATRKFGNAVKARDADAIRQMIDTAAVAESMVDLMVEATVARAQQVGKNADAVRAQVLKVTKTPAFKKYMEQALSPEMLARSLASGHATTAKGDESIFRNEKWNSPLEFSVQDKESDGRAVFRFRGVGWKLCRLELPKSQIVNLAAMMGPR